MPHLSFRHLVLFTSTALIATGLLRGADTAKSDATAAPVTPAPAANRLFSTANADEWLRIGRNIFDQVAPPEVKTRIEFPSPEKWTAFATRLQRALDGNSLTELAVLAEDARSTLSVLRGIPASSGLADWLEQRLDAIDGAKQALTPREQLAPTPQAPLRPGQPVPSTYEPVPHYNLWLERVRSRPVPAKARELLPRVQAAFVAEKMPAELVWLAEAESSFNPSAASPVGAKGLFQFMPTTAKAMGLQTLAPDERTDPEKSARAAARYLRSLHGRFGNWALAIAAYNAGEGRVSRTLTAKHATTFTAISEALPAETQMYVPKVCALVATRAGVPPERIASPR